MAQKNKVQNKLKKKKIQNNFSVVQNLLFKTHLNFQGSKKMADHNKNQKLDNLEHLNDYLILTKRIKEINVPLDHQRIKQINKDQYLNSLVIEDHCLNIMVDQGNI
jgi:hypothetical protein